MYITLTRVLCVNLMYLILLGLHNNNNYYLILEAKYEYNYIQSTLENNRDEI